MKILLATSKGIPAGGGIASYNQELVRLLGKDNDIYLLTDADENNVDGYKKTYRTFGNKNSDFEYCKILVDNINSANYDCIINSNSSFIPVLAPFLNTKIVSVSHFVNGKFAINAGYNSKYQMAIIALSHYSKQFIANKFNITNRNKIKVVYNFVSSALQQNKSKLTRHPLRIVYPGGTSISKSADIVQQVVYKLLSSDLDFEFYWLGGTRLPSAKYSVLGLRELTDLFDADSRLKITGLISREKALEIISSANIFLLPSRGEGCPMTLLEAMREGCIPIVSDAQHGSREILEMSQTGFVVKQGSSKMIFDLLQNIINNPKKYEKNYDQTSSFLKKSLSAEIWRKQMNDILYGQSPTPKIILPINRNKFKSQSILFNILYKLEDFKLILRSIYYRIKLDFYYLKNKLKNI